MPAADLFQQHQHRARSALRRPGGDKADHFAALTQPAIDHTLENAFAAATFAVDDAQAAATLGAGVGEELDQDLLGLVHPQMVQIDFALDAELSAAELFQ